MLPQPRTPVRRRSTIPTATHWKLRAVLLHDLPRQGDLLTANERATGSANIQSMLNRSNLSPTAGFHDGQLWVDKRQLGEWKTVRAIARSSGRS